VVRSRLGMLAVTTVAMLAVAMLTGCPGAKPINELLDDPGRYEGKTVRIAGEVKESIGGFGVGAFQLNDGTGTLTVVTKAGSAPPRVGAKVGVEGEFRSAFTLGTLTVAVLVERERRTQ
jgi:DNA/RNA endonuclease YhcR with UshA esterase domain